MTCKCFEKVNTQFAEHNTMLDMRMCLNREDGRMTLEPQLAIATSRIKNLRDGKQAKVVVATFCPFCGKSLTAKRKRKAQP
jgi:hypothetical protein